MTKKLFIIIYCSLLISLFTIHFFKDRNDVYDDNTIQIKEENTLSMMIEQTA